jgi:choline kinase
MIEELIILTNDNFEPDESRKRGLTEQIQRVTGKLREVKLNPAEIEVQMTGFVQVVSRIFRQTNSEISANSGLRLEEVELVVKISAKGQIQLIAGGEVGGEGGITLKFKRFDSNESGK